MGGSEICRQFLDTTTGMARLNGVATFTGTLGDKSGTFMVNAHGKVINGVVSGEFNIHSGTGQIAGISGHASFTGTAGGPVTYNVTWHFSGHEVSPDQVA